MIKREDKITDEQIINTVVKGDIESFKYIVKRYQKTIFNIGMRFFKNIEDSYDFTQEVFINSFKKIETFKGFSPFRFWLVKVAYNLGINSTKSHKSESSIIEESIECADYLPEEKHIANEIHYVLKKEINLLPEKYRICLDLYFFLGLSYMQINKITDIPVNTIKSNVFRAKGILRDKLKGTIAEKYNELR